MEQFLASHESSPLDRVQKTKVEQRGFASDLRCLGKGFRGGFGRLSRDDESEGGEK